jgi:hypothetical protein
MKKGVKIELPSISERSSRQSVKPSKFKVSPKLPSSMNTFIEKLKRDFSITEHNPQEQIRAANRNSEIMKDLKIKEYLERVSYLKTEKEKFKRNKIDNKICNTWDGDTPQEKILNIFNSTRGSKVNVNSMIKTIDDISDNLNKIGRKLTDKCVVYKKNSKMINLEFDILETEYHPLKKTGLPVFVKSKFDKKTQANYKAISGKNFGGSRK